MTTTIIEYRPPRIAISLILAATVINLYEPINTREIYASAWVAILLMLGGFTVMMVAWWQFKQRAVAICPTESTASLITDGIYRCTRNPMYLGLTSMLAGLAVYIGTLPFYMAAAVFLAIIHLKFCPYEESKLRREFGSEYAQYASKVRRWI
jgi:protein-S-isoprenylcysteine O-methyltransferase Ste14